MKKVATGTTKNRDDFRDIAEPEFERIRRILKSLTGVRLSCYKDACIRRRLAVRIRAVGCATAEEYADLLLRDTSEPVQLMRTLTIHVSKFFRNPDTFQKIRDAVLPSLFSLCHRQGRESLNIRSVGCACGEEPYTLALILRHFFHDELSRFTVCISASDIDSQVLKNARQGVYFPESLEEAPEAIRNRYFRKREGRYHLLPEIREMVEFHHDDLVHSAGARECDLILCRNVLIYFERDHQDDILRGFADSLHSGGFLVLGKTESLAERSRGLFRAEFPVERIYRKR
ncbi:MAG TPA: protein-glutamate O-methyltransferase CheR [Geobacteraceae bacterium]|nr:protein-glutamate O-methyltransferase CheR [Geobacteraceae bacterium]